MRTAADLGGAIARLRPTRGERATALDSLIQRVIGADGPLPEQAGAAITGLGPTRRDRRRVHRILTEAMEREVAGGNTARACSLASLAAELELTVGERARVAHVLLSAIAAEISQESVRDLAQAGLGLDPDPGKRELFRVRALEATLALCASRKSRLRALESLPELVATADERARALNAVLEVLAGEDHALLLVGKALGSMADTAEAKERLRAAFFAKLAGAADPHAIGAIAELLRPLVHRQEDRDRLRAGLLGKLDRMTAPSELALAAGVIGELSANESGKAEARRLLLNALIENGVGGSTEWTLTREIVALRPVVTDLDGLGDPPYGLSHEVLAAMRENSSLDDWLTALPKTAEPRKAAGAGGPLPGSGPTGLPSVTRPAASQPNA